MQRTNIKQIQSIFGHKMIIGSLVAGSLLLSRLLRKTPSGVNKFRNKNVLITGGSRGLGFILAQKFAAESATIILCARDEIELQRAKEKIKKINNKISTFVCDVANEEQVQLMIESVVHQFGKIDILINNASIIQVGPLSSMNLEDFKKAMSINFWGTAHTTLFALPSMIQQRNGHIVNITSIGAVISVPHLLPYTAAKFAARGFSEGLTTELAQNGVRVTTVIPGLMRTGSFLNALFKGNQKAEVSWFSLGASLPILSLDAERAADKIIRAIRNGNKIVTLGIPARIGTLIYKLFPERTITLLSWINQALPKSDNSQQNPEPGKIHQTRISNSLMTVLGRHAAQRFNEAGRR